MEIFKKLLTVLVVLTFGLSSAFADGVNYSAYVNYGTNVDYPMSGIIANLYNSNGDFVASTVTDDNGIFTFTDLVPGQNYSVHFDTERAPFGVDLQDAFLLLNYLTGRAELAEIQLLAADVNGDTRVNFSDFAFIVSQWYLRGESFPAGDWVFPVWTFTASGFKTTGGIDGPITIVSQSDISSELDPVIKVSPVLNNENEFVFTDSQYGLTLPVSFVQNQQLNGLGIEMAFNSSDVEIIGLQTAFSEADYVFENNGFKLSWVGNSSESLAAGQPFVNLQVRLHNADALESVLLAVAEAQFIGSDGNMLEKVQLNMPKLKKSIAELSLGTPYPNPANQEISFALNQPYTNMVSVEIYNLSGQLIKQINASPRNSKITISTSDLPTGSYLFSVKMDAQREAKLINVQH